MEKEKIICLFLFFVLILVSSSCHPRHVSDIKPNMTKEEVVSLWGGTPLITYSTVDGKAVEIWEYHFSGTDSICRITFSQDRVVVTQCHPKPRGVYGYYYPSERKPRPPSVEQDLVREGSFAMKLAEALKVGEVNNEAEAESRLAQIGIAPRNGWIADYPVTPGIIGELQNAVSAAADSGELAMEKEEAMMVFQGLISDIQDQHARAKTPFEEQPPPGPYRYSYPYYRYYYPYYYPYPYPYFYFRFYPFYRPWR